jgi:spore coat polysaccharide biosynthesis protein SpsF
MKVVAIIQARMGSTRLPGKVMLNLREKTVLAHVIERVKTCPRLNLVVVATTTSGVDNIIEREALSCGALVYRGSEHDVLARYYEAGKTHDADVIVRVTSDCPLFDPILLTRMIKAYSNELEASQKLDYLSNALERTYPRGLDAEIFSSKALSIAHQRADLPHQREHVTPYIYQNPQQFRIQNFSEGWALQEHRWTLDTKEDWELISEIYRAFQPGRIFTTEEVVEFLQARPDLVAINQNIQQKPLMGNQ